MASIVASGPSASTICYPVSNPRSIAGGSRLRIKIIDFVKHLAGEAHVKHSPELGGGVFALSSRWDAVKLFHGRGYNAG
jgi:hypothetical protein